MIAEALSAMLPRAARNGPLDDYWYRPVGSQSTAGVEVRPDNAMAVATVYRCVRLLAETLGSLSLRVYERIGNDRRGRKIAAGNELDDVLYNQPNRWQSPVDFVEQIVTHVCLRGNYYAQKVRRPPEGGLELAPFVEPLRMTVTQAPTGYLTYSYRLPNGQPTKEYIAPQIFHVRGLSLDGINGVSVLDFARNSIGMSIAQESHGANVFKAGGVPPMWIERPAGRWDKEAKQNFRKSFRGVTATGEVPIMEDGMKLHGMEIDNVNLQWIESQKFSGEQICRFFGVPPWAVGLEPPPTNTDQAIAQLVKLTIRPWAVRIEAAADIQLVDEINRYYTKFSLDEIERASMMTRFQANNIGVQGGWLTRNECRIDEDREPLEGLDEPLEALNMQPAGGMADINEQGGEPGKGKPVYRPAKKPKKQAEEEPDEDDGAEARKLQLAFSVLLQDAAKRLASREYKFLNCRIAKATGDQAKWEAFCEDAYASHAEYCDETLCPLIDAWESMAGESISMPFLNRIHPGWECIKDGQQAATILEHWQTNRQEMIFNALKEVFFHV